MDTTWECIVVGGGAAGLSAALVLGRARRRTLLVDAGEQSNLAADHVGGLLGHDGRPARELYAAGHREIAAYPAVEIRAGTVTGGERDEGAFVLTLGDGTRETARTVLLATGMEYRHPELPGVAERWGRSVFHCPFCHGWEVRDRALGVLDRGAAGVRRARLLRGWSDDVTLYADGDAALEEAQAAELRAAGVRVEERRVAGVRGPGATLEAVVLEGAEEVPCDGLLVPITMHQRSGLAAQLGVAAEEPNPIHADALRVDAMLATSVPGVYAAGDVTPQMPSVAGAIAAGSRAAAMIVHDLAFAA